MHYQEWDNLPRLKPIENLKDVGKIPIELNLGVFAIAKDLSEKWVKNRETYSKQTGFQEDLVALILTIAVTYATQELHAPGRLAGNPSNSAVDRIIAVPPKVKSLANEVNGLTLQVVSTAGINLHNREVNSAILQRIKDKHKKGRSYTEGLQLAVFVTQDDWQIEIDQLIDVIEKERHYSSYWVILPLARKKDAIFVVNYLGLDKKDRGQGQVTVSIKDGIRARFLGLYLQDGRLDDVKEYVEYLKSKAV